MHGLTLKGELPLGVTYEFINNYHKEVGIYEVIVEFNIASYAPLKATLTIVKADIDMSNVFSMDRPLFMMVRLIVSL